MNKVLLLIISLLATSCVATPRSKQGDLSMFAHDRVIEIAKRELERRSLALPTKYDVAVKDGKARVEFEPVREIYVVLFSFAHRGHKSVIYTVHIDKRTGNIDDVSDSRTAIPSQI